MEAPEVSFGTETYPSLNATLANGITHLAVEFNSDVKGHRAMRNRRIM